MFNFLNPVSPPEPFIGDLSTASFVTIIIAIIVVLAVAVELIIVTKKRK